MEATTPGTGTIAHTTAPMMPAAHTGPNSGAMAMLATGAAKGSWLNKAAENGVASTDEANVNANASRTKAGNHPKQAFNHELAKPPNTTIPSVAKTDSANEDDNAAWASRAIITAMQHPSADNEEARRRAVHDVIPANVISVARMAEAGIAVSARYAANNMI